MTRFPQTCASRGTYTSILGEAQRFRGQVYVTEHNLRRSDLTADARHVQEADYKSWHLLTMTEAGEVGSCARICVHPAGARFQSLVVSHSALAHSDVWGAMLREAVEREMADARERKVHFAEIGGWAVARHLRCSTEAIRLLVTGYALGQVLGGLKGVSTANLRHHSSSILRRMGARPLTARGNELPPYYEPLYSSELEILEFDSARPSPRYWFHIQQSCTALSRVTVVCPEPSNPLKSPLGQLEMPDREMQPAFWQYDPPFAMA